MSYASGSLFRFRGRAISATLVLVALHVVSMLLGLAISGWNEALAYSSDAVLGKFSIWQLFTYAFVHTPTLWFAIGMFFFYWFGHEVEKFLGQQAYLMVYAILVFTPGLCATVAGLSGDITLQGSTFASLGIFAMFAFLYPTVELIFRIQARWLAVGLAAIYMLQAIGTRDWSGAAIIVAMVLTVFEIARRLGIRSAVVVAERISPDYGAEPAARKAPQKPQKVKVLQQAKQQAAAPEPEYAEPDVDAILDKISRSGISSLTDAEKDQLETARKKLIEKEVDR